MPKPKPSSITLFTFIQDHGNSSSSKPAPPKRTRPAAGTAKRNALDQSAPTTVYRGFQKKRQRRPGVFKKAILQQRQQLALQVKSMAMVQSVRSMEFKAHSELPHKKPPTKCAHHVACARLQQPPRNRGEAQHYCYQLTHADYISSTRDLLSLSAQYQVRLYKRKPLLANKRKRLLIGLKEVSKHLDRMASVGRVATRPLLAVAMARNIEPALDNVSHNLVAAIVHKCQQLSVPVLFPLTRRQFGKALHGVTKRHSSVSACGILSFDGVKDSFERCIQLATRMEAAFAQQFAHACIRSSQLLTSAWILACAHGYPQHVLQQCLDAGWSAHDVDPKTGNTALHLAVVRDALPLARWIHAQNGELVMQRNFGGETPLFMATKLRRASIVAWMATLSSYAVFEHIATWTGRRPCDLQ